jgi:hypothetical protein
MVTAGAPPAAGVVATVPGGVGRNEGQAAQIAVHGLEAFEVTVDEAALQRERVGLFLVGRTGVAADERVGEVALDEVALREVSVLPHVDGLVHDELEREAFVRA